MQVKSLSQRLPVALGANPKITADWVNVCTGVRANRPRCFVLTPGEVGRLAYRDKHGENHWLQTSQYDAREVAERWDRLDCRLA